MLSNAHTHEFSARLHSSSEYEPKTINPGVVIATSSTKNLTSCYLNNLLVLTSLFHIQNVNDRIENFSLRYPSGRSVRCSVSEHVYLLL